MCDSRKTPANAGVFYWLRKGWAFLQAQSLLKLQGIILPLAQHLELVGRRGKRLRDQGFGKGFQRVGCPGLRVGEAQLAKAYPASLLVGVQGFGKVSGAVTEQ